MLNIGDMDLADKLLFHVAMLSLSIEGNALQREYKLRLKRLLLVLLCLQAKPALQQSVASTHPPHFNTVLLDRPQQIAAIQLLTRFCPHPQLFYFQLIGRKILPGRHCQIRRLYFRRVGIKN